MSTLSYDHNQIKKDSSTVVFYCSIVVMPSFGPTEGRLFRATDYWWYLWHFPESPRTQVEKQLTAVRHNCTVVLVGVIDLHLESGIYAGAIGNIGCNLVCTVLEYCSNTVVGKHQLTVCV